MAKKPGDMRDRILDAGEAMVRQHGFHGVSFREIADAVGIKSASVHYHFPSKEDFALAVTERYISRFMDAAREALSSGETHADALKAYADLYRKAFDDDGKMCLCGMLAAESATLPGPVREKVASFFDKNAEALGKALGSEDDARLTLAALQGAMLIARAEQSSEEITRVAKSVAARFE